MISELGDAKAEVHSGVQGFNLEAVRLVKERGISQS